MAVCLSASLADSIPLLMLLCAAVAVTASGRMEVRSPNRRVHQPRVSARLHILREGTMQILCGWSVPFSLFYAHTHAHTHTVLLTCPFCSRPHFNHPRLCDTTTHAVSGWRWWSCLPWSTTSTDNWTAWPPASSQRSSATWQWWTMGGGAVERPTCFESAIRWWD